VRTPCFILLLFYFYFSFSAVVRAAALGMTVMCIRRHITGIVFIKRLQTRFYSYHVFLRF